MDILIVCSDALTAFESNLLKQRALKELEDYTYVSIIFYPEKKLVDAGVTDPFVDNLKKEGIVFWKRKD